MIISHKYKYIFVQLPRSASTSIGRELCEQYDGHKIKILPKHSLYSRFLRIANAEEKNYFVFSSIRNPLDVVVSIYTQFKDDNWGVYNDPRKWRKNGGWVSDYQLRQFNFVNNNKADFPTFFKKYYKLTYENRSGVDHKYYDFVIRFENLQDDFSKVLELIGIETKRPLPNVNKTKNKDKSFWDYYTPEIRSDAKAIFGCFMKRWGYDFPPEWGDNSIPLHRQLEYEILNIPRHLYWRYLHRY